MKNKINLISSFSDPNQDIRSKIAHDTLDKYKGKHTLLHKATRAGCTTSMSSASIDRGDTFLMTVPNNMIVETTIIEDVKKYCNHPNPKIVHVKSNRYCKYNQELYEKYPALERLPYLPKAKNCDKCEHFYTCPVTEILRFKNPQGIVITYDKLFALMKASSNKSNTMALDILEKILSVDNVIFDEAHSLQYAKKVVMPVCHHSPENNWIKLEKYDCLRHNFEFISMLLDSFAKLVESYEVQINTRELFELIKSNDKFKENTVRKIENPSCILAKENGVNRFFNAAYIEIIAILKSSRSENGLSVEDIVLLEKMLTIVTSRYISIELADSKGQIETKFMALDYNYLPKVQKFIKMVQNNKKTIIFTSATICSFDYNSLFSGPNKESILENIMFGLNGDPLNNNSRMLILADSKRYHVEGKRSIANMLKEITSNTIEILNHWGDDNCMIVAPNTSTAIEIKKSLEEAGHAHEVTYYNASNMMGVSSNARVMITIGIAYKPTHAYDYTTLDRTASLILKEESVHSDTWQALSRVKDPNGKVPSVVFALGCSIEDCQYFTKWGFKREVQIHPYSLGQKRNIKIECMDEQVSSPEIIKCKNIDEMIERAAFHTQCQNALSVYGPKPLLLLYNNINNSGFNYITNTILLKSKLMSMFIANDKFHCKQSNDSTIKKVASKITNDDIVSHLNGALTLSTYSLINQNEVKWICFDMGNIPIDTDESECSANYQKLRNIHKLMDFLSAYHIPFQIERNSGSNSYRIWIFLKPVAAKLVKELGKWIQKESGVKCTMFPKKTEVKRTSQGDAVPLPFGTHQEHGTKSEFWINGSFTQDFDQINIGIMDILKFNKLKTEQYVETPASDPIHNENLHIKDVTQVDKLVSQDVVECQLVSILSN